jgi:hypothetical protein
MKRFIAQHRGAISAVLSGFDRLVFRGTLLPLMRQGGMFFFLEKAGVRLLDYKDYVWKTSESVRETAMSEARKLGRPTKYLVTGDTNKEKIAKELLAEHHVDQGLICTLSTVEPCMSFEYHLSQNRAERGLRLRLRKCLHLYKYFLHPKFGFMSVRLQTWFPFNVQICLNGREWLAWQFKRRGHTDFLRADNCFPRLGDPKLAQRLMNEQLKTAWARELDRIARLANPLHDSIFKAAPMSHYWSAYQTEWATDLMFKEPRSLGAIYPALIRHGMEHFKSPDVMRFLGRKAHGNFVGELTTDFKDRLEGVRIKHWVRGNSIKMYDKAGSILRVETTIGRTTDFKVLRPRHDDPTAPLEWKRLRKGVADLHRRAQLSQRANETYLDALSAVNNKTPCSDLFDAVNHRVSHNGRAIRAMRLGDPHDLALLESIARGEFATAGFRNRDIRGLTQSLPKNASKKDQRRAAAKTSRDLRLLRAHGVIQKVPKSHRYRLTANGHLLIAALFAARRADISQLLAKAA